MALRRRLVIGTTPGSGGVADVPSLAGATSIGRLTSYDGRGLRGMMDEATAAGQSITRGLWQIGTEPGTCARMSITADPATQRLIFSLSLGSSVYNWWTECDSTGENYRFFPANRWIIDPNEAAWRPDEMHLSLADRQIFCFYVHFTVRPPFRLDLYMADARGRVSCYGIGYHWSDASELSGGPIGSTCLIGHTDSGPACGLVLVRDAVYTDLLPWDRRHTKNIPDAPGVPSAREAQEEAAGWNFEAAPLGAGAVPSLVSGGPALALTGVQVVDLAE